jgi:calcineurin-like phosphoesterase family protein
MNTFVIADPHLDHEDIILHCRRPWCVPNPAYDPALPFDFKGNNPLTVTRESMEAHNQAFHDAWNRMVGRRDRVIVVGDFAFRNHARHAAALNGHKVLVLGNHDDMSKEAMGHFSEVHDFGCVRRMDTGRLPDGGAEREKVTFCHYAMRAWPGSWEGTAALHGHSHGRMPELDILLSFDVGVDVWGYFPIPWEAIRLRIDQKRASMGAREASENGDGRARGAYSPDPDERVLESRARNLAVLKAVGIEVPQDHFSMSVECVAAVRAQREADRMVSSVVATAGATNRHGRTYDRAYLRSIADGSSLFWDEGSGTLTFRCRTGFAADQEAVRRFFKDRLSGGSAATGTGEDANGQDGGKAV